MTAKEASSVLVNNATTVFIQSILVKNQGKQMVQADLQARHSVFHVGGECA